MAQPATAFAPGTAAPCRSDDQVAVAAVVINHNYGPYLHDAVASLLAQEVPFAEVLVVDDGSTDDSAAVMGTLPDGIRLIQKENGGQLSAALAALPFLTADYVYFLDADDRAFPT